MFDLPVLIIARQVPSHFFSLQNSARGGTSETPIYPSLMENMSDVTKRMVSTWMPHTILELFIQNESCPIKCDACALYLFIMRHVSSIFRLWLKMRMYQTLDKDPCLLPITS